MRSFQLGNFSILFYFEEVLQSVYTKFHFSKENLCQIKLKSKLISLFELAWSLFAVANYMAIH